jgi:hypothetical protein
MTAPATTLAAELVEAQRIVRSVAKDAKFGGGQNDRGPKYAYASSEAVYGEARSALVSAGLAASLASSHVYVMIYWDIWTTEQGEVRRDEIHQVMLRCHFLLVHAQSDQKREDTCELPVITGKGRGLDKAIMGVRTTALAYYLRDLLLMQRGDFDEVDSREDEERPAQPARQAPAHQPASTPSEPIQAIVSRDIAAATTEKVLLEIAAKIEKTPELRGAMLEAIKGEWKAKRDELRGVKA